MLIVIAIIAVLAGLLLPAIQMAREAARRASCSNNLKNLTLAIQQFDQAKGQYPASRTFWNNPNYKALSIYPPSLTSSTKAIPATLTWVHEIMPYIDQLATRARIENQDATVFNQHAPQNTKEGLMFGVPIWAIDGGSGKLGIVFCPSDETDDSLSANTDLNGAQLKYSQLSYGINAGVPDNLSMTTPAYGPDWPANGVIENKMRGTAELPPPVGNNLRLFKTTMADVVNGDGATNTLILADNGDLEEWNYAPTEYHVGIVWDDYNWSGTAPQLKYTGPQLLNKYPAGLSPPNTKPDTLLNIYSASSANVLAFARPLSNHPGGFMAAFCDGRTRFISETVAYDVYAKLMTSSGKKYAVAGMAPNAPAYSNLRQMLSVPLKDGDY
jgi:type II secretory pathway pseudopilin PulG